MAVPAAVLESGPVRHRLTWAFLVGVRTRTSKVRTTLSPFWNACLWCCDHIRGPKLIPKTFNIVDVPVYRPTTKAAEAKKAEKEPTAENALAATAASPASVAHATSSWGLSQVYRKVTFSAPSPAPSTVPAGSFWANKTSQASKKSTREVHEGGEAAAQVQAAFVAPAPGPLGSRPSTFSITRNPAPSSSSAKPEDKTSPPSLKFIRWMRGALRPNSAGANG